MDASHGSDHPPTSPADLGECADPIHGRPSFRTAPTNPISSGQTGQDVLASMAVPACPSRALDNLHWPDENVAVPVSPANHGIALYEHVGNW